MGGVCIFSRTAHFKDDKGIHASLVQSVFRMHHFEKVFVLQCSVLKCLACSAGVFHGRALNNKFSSRISRRLRGKGGGGGGQEMRAKKNRLPANPV